MSMPTTRMASTNCGLSICANASASRCGRTKQTGTLLMSRFGYCFYTAPGSDYPPDPHSQPASRRSRWSSVAGEGGDIAALPFILHHGNIDALGFRIGDVAYTPDLNGIPEASLAALTDLDLWIVDALRRDAASEPFQPGRDACLDRTAEAQARHPHQHAYRSRL